MSPPPTECLIGPYALRLEIPQEGADLDRLTLPKASDLRRDVSVLAFEREVRWAEARDDHTRSERALESGHGQIPLLILVGSAGTRVARCSTTTKRHTVPPSQLVGVMRQS